MSAVILSFPSPRPDRARSDNEIARAEITSALTGYSRRDIASAVQCAERHIRMGRCKTFAVMQALRMARGSFKPEPPSAA